jgi:fluoride exporter
MVGGAVGAAGREGVSLAVPTVDDMPLAIPIVNIVGAFMLGYLSVAIARRLPDDPRGPRLKLLVGTGFCGGFTTYSSLATDTAVLLDESHVDLAVVYVLATLLIGAVATFVGILAATRLGTREQPVAEGTQR